jgi:hypothetical protein
MNKILIALAITGFTCLSAQAQENRTLICPAPKGQVCHRSGHGTSCYKTKYAEDFKICKGDYGYYVCCETPGLYNSTHPKLTYVAPFDNGEDMDNLNEVVVLHSQTPDMEGVTPESLTPQSQSYPPYSDKACVGTCATQHKPCYGGNNVAMLNRAPYNGCPTPAYDGPDANRQRNVNVSNYTDHFAPINGQPE